MNLHETKYGQRFFDCQLPKLIAALESIATAMAKKPPMIQFPMDMPADFLKDVYHGNLEPDAAPSPSKPLDKAVEAAYAQLKEQAPPEIQHQVEAYRLATEERYDLYLDQAFAIGYQTAMRFVAAGLTATAEPKGDA